MNCSDIKEKFVDFLTGELEEKGKEMLQSHLRACPSCREELESLSETWTKLGVLPEEKPSPGLRARFYSMLEDYKESLEHTKHVFRLQDIFEKWFAAFWPRRPAFQFSLSLFLILIGLTAGYFLNSGGKRGAEISGLRQEVQSIRQTLALSLLENSSPTERLKGVSLSYEIEKPGSEIPETLLHTLNNDPNINVRLAAVDALYLFYESPRVKESLVDSLSIQSSPLVQVALINLMVNIRERRAIDALEQLIKDEKLNPDVKNRAEQGIKQLSY